MKLLTTLSVAALLFVGCSGSVKQETFNPILTIEGGQVQGIMDDAAQVIIYKGIPYAAAPVGELRWKKPQPVTPWQGVKMADKWGNAAIQASAQGMALYTKEFYSDGDPERSEDCLFLNVWTPANAAGNTSAKLPVAMWIHGGAYDHGWSYEKEMDGEAWAQHDVILVTINYRVGIFGFMAHPLLSAEDANGVSGNYGTYDQVAALKWIKNNIAQFGGDPDNITILGQSAGASSIKNLVTSPLSKGLISRAIIQSGGGLTQPIQNPEVKENEEAKGKKVMDAAGWTTLAQMRAASADEVQLAFVDYNAKVTDPRERVGFRPFTDGVLLPKDFNQAVYDNEIADVPYMIGYVTGDRNANESVMRFCTVHSSQTSKPIFAYHFARPLPGDDAGAFHSSELWYMFHTLGRAWRPFTEADYALSDKMVDYWTNFAKYGNPNGKAAAIQNWKASTADEPYLQVLDIE
ncbi:MAG: carboxylesterase family protein [Bacteroidaceae bacterium]|nr:carboxylesterase family protein [Bacteroidaceae bacterium]